MKSEIRAICFINAHKVLAAPIIIGMMYWFHNWSTEAFLYLGLHGTYATLWLLKSAVYPDKSFSERRLPFWGEGLAVFLLLGTYYIAPYLLLSRHVLLSSWLVGLVICCYTVGMFLHFVGDAQKYYTLRFRSGLIEEGLFAHTRNPNYLGETLIYISFATVSCHWVSFLVLGGWLGFYFANMQRKDRSLARYPDFTAYKARTGLFFPSLGEGWRLQWLLSQSSKPEKCFR